MKRVINIPQLIAISGALSLSLLFNNCAKFEGSEEIYSEFRQGKFEVIQTLSLEEFEDYSILCSDVGIVRPNPFTQCVYMHIDTDRGYANSNGLNPELPIASTEKLIENMNTLFSHPELDVSDVIVIFKFYSSSPVAIPISELEVGVGYELDTSSAPGISIAYE